MAVWVVVIPLLVLVQVTLVAFLPFRWAVPDLVLVSVLGIAHHHGSLTGGLLGAWAGLWLDLVPPAVGPLGGWILVLGVAGSVHGHVVVTRRPGPLLALALLTLSAAAATVGHALVLWFAGVPLAADAVARAAVGAAAWGLVLAPVALLVTGGRISGHDPREMLERPPTLLEAVTPGWVGSTSTSAASAREHGQATAGSAGPGRGPGGPWL